MHFSIATGVGLGYARVAPANQTLTTEQVYILAMAGDLEDLSAAIPYLSNNTDTAHLINTPNPSPSVTNKSVIQSNWRSLCNMFSTRVSFGAIAFITSHYFLLFSDTPTHPYGLLRAC